MKYSTQIQINLLLLESTGKKNHFLQKNAKFFITAKRFTQGIFTYQKKIISIFLPIAHEPLPLQINDAYKRLAMIENKRMRMLMISLEIAKRLGFWAISENTIARFTTDTQPLASYNRNIENSSSQPSYSLKAWLFITVQDPI